MDLWLIETDQSTQIRPETVHGILWLQTHFEDAHWDALASKQVCISIGDAKALCADAKEAGLNVNYLPAPSIAGQL